MPEMRHIALHGDDVAYRLSGEGETLLQGVLESATDATGSPGSKEDLVLLDADAPALAGATRDDLVDRWLFAGNRSLVKQVRVAGREVVTDGQHVEREAIARRYGETLRQLLRD